MILKPIIFFGHAFILACDAKCEKAWGMSQRPKVQISANEDDTAYKSDEELGTAPIYPGTYEGEDGKPLCEADRLNKWCCRECERSVMVDHVDDIKLPDFSQRVYNIRR